MKKYNELKEIIEKQEKTIFEPVFRVENDKLYLGYIIMELLDDYKMKSSNEWLLQDLETGEVTVNKDTVSDKIFEASSKTILYNGINDIWDHFYKFKKDVLQTLGKISKIQDYEILKVERDLFSPSDYIMANIENVLNEMDNHLKQLGNIIEEAYKEYQISLIDEIISEYGSGIVDKRLIKKYNDFLKYLWTEQVELIECFDNIH